MAKYIYADGAYLVLTEYYHHKTEAQHKALREALDRVPAADVAEVRHSVWVGIDDYPHDTWECANCGRIIEGDREAFCPSCGARMVNEDE